MNNKKYITIAVYTALLTVIGFILNMIEIPYIIPWLKIEISEVATLIATSISPIIGACVAILKALLMSITGTTTGFLGEITLFIGSITVVLVYSILKKIRSEIFSLVVVVVAFTIVMTVLNYYIITPFYFGQSFKELSSSTQTLAGTVQVNYAMYIIAIYVPFNFIKMTINAVIFYSINKRLNNVLNR